MSETCTRTVAEKTYQLLVLVAICASAERDLWQVHTSGSGEMIFIGLDVNAFVVSAGRVEGGFGGQYGNSYVAKLLDRKSVKELAMCGSFRVREPGLNRICRPL